MRQTLLTVTMIAFVAIIASDVANAQKKPFRSQSANLALARYGNAVTAAEREYTKDVSEARKELLRVLKMTLTATTKAGDLKEANKLQATITQLENSLKKPTGKAGGLKELVGTWKAKGPNDRNTQTYRISADGTMLVENGNLRHQWKVVPKAGKLYVIHPTKGTTVLTVAGDRLLQEWWPGTKDSGFPNIIRSGFRVK